jgi:CHAT domain-containing protein
MPQQKKSRYRREGFLGVVLISLSLSLALLFFVSPEISPIEFEKTEVTDALIQLAPGSSLHRDLAPGAQEVIGIQVGQGRLLRFSIDKGDLGLSTVLYGPTGTQLVEHMSQEFEPVELSVPADAGGQYKIELRSLETAGPRRPLEIKVDPLTPVNAVERKDSEARQALANATVLQARWKNASLLQAIEQYDKAAQIWASVSDFSNSAMALIKAGDVSFRLTHYPEALKHFEDAEALDKRTGDRISEGLALSHKAHLYSYTGDNDRAYSTLAKALELLDSHLSDSTSIVSHAYAEAYSHMAEVIYARGDMLKARNYFNRARELLADDRKGKARTHLFAGYIAGGSTGQPDKAIDEISTALTLYQATGDKAGEGLALIALGLFQSSKKNAGKALQLNREALKTFQTIGDRHSEALALVAIGQACEAGGDWEAALQNYENASERFEKIGALDFAIAAVYKIGAVELANKHLEQALVYYDRALSLSRTGKKHRLEALALEGIALVYDAQGRTEDAIKQYRSVQQFYENTSDVRGQAVALNNYGDFLLKLGQKHEALEAYQRALPLSRQLGDNSTLLTTLYNLSRAHLGLGHFETALAIIKDSINTIEQLRDNAGSPDLRALYFAVVKKHYDLWVAILMQFDRVEPGKGYDVQALLVSDQSRARSLIDLLSRQPADSSADVSPEILEHERELRGLISAQAQYQMELRLSGKNPDEVAEVSNEVAQLRAEYQEVEAQLWKQTPKLDSVRSYAPTSLKQVQDELRDPNTMLLEFALGDEHSYLWAVTANSFQSYELPPRRPIEEAARQVLSFMSARQAPVETIKGDYAAFIQAADEAFPEKARELSQMLLGPISAELGHKKLLISTEGALQAVPFDALPAPGAASTGPLNQDAFADSLLINTNEISFSPSISTLRAIRSEKKNTGSPDRTVAVIADPVFSTNDERVRSAPVAPIVADASSSDQQGDGFAQRGLPGLLRGGTLSRLAYSATEADAITAAAPYGTSMIVKGFAANRETLMSSRVGEYQILHFATHAFLDTEHPELSGIVLTMVDPKGLRQNGVMPLQDVYSLKLSSELTVLSACQTALGKDISGEGFMGLTHSFLSAGSKSVVASLWKVDDRATANLMTRLYESLLQQGMSTGAALREAKLKTMREKQWRAPYFWAGFVLQGESTNHIVVQNRWWRHPGWALFALLVLASSLFVVFRRRKRQSATA